MRFAAEHPDTRAEIVTLLAGIIDEHRWDSPASRYDEDACICGVRFNSPGIRAWRTHRAAMILERLERYGYRVMREEPEPEICGFCGEKVGTAVVDCPSMLSHHHPEQCKHCGRYESEHLEQPQVVGCDHFEVLT